MLNKLKILNPFLPVNERDFKFPVTEVLDIYRLSQNKSYVNCINFVYKENNEIKNITRHNIVDWFIINFDEIKNELEEENNYEFYIPQINFANPLDVMIFLFYFVENKNRLTLDKYYKEIDNYLNDIDKHLNLTWKNVGHQINMYNDYN